MNINVGSTNPTKIDAVRNITSDHELFKGAKIVGVDVAVEEFGHPKSLRATVEGAQQRARKAYGNCQYSVGLESGMFKAYGTKSGYLETTACAIYDGQRFYVGLGPSFEWPPKVTKLILEGYDGSQAFKKAGLTEHHKLGMAQGAIHMLTHGKINRTKLNEMAFMMALIHLENPNDYN